MPGRAINNNYFYTIFLSKGDGGSPLVCIDGDSAVVHGLRSWGVDCSDEGQPSVFASVNTQISWIDNVIATAEEAEAAQENDKQKSLEVMPTPAWGFEEGSERIPSKLSEGCSNDVETGFGFARSRFLGIAAKRNTYPWMARLNLCPTIDDCYRCAGTIIADNFILSSASCFQGEFQKISVRFLNAINEEKMSFRFESATTTRRSLKRVNFTCKHTRGRLIQMQSTA